ncbi:nucleotidyl transferase AbiEii/AbiGii toxin family protein, partial [Desulfovibrio sp. OttesenSCG-928-C14]|nr:nucleotidyl transferase AbiEii/AbiGii toxin family protein [Desulfovibrio sp. OttesenSCG-928-C14]
MKLNDEGKKLFGYAMERLAAADISREKWSFGGGTSLMLRYNHRESKDIDIFFRDPQLLSFVSPRINDAGEDKIKDYSEHTQFTRIVFSEGEIDFIVAPQLTQNFPELLDVEGFLVMVDSPVEVVAKKVHFRASEFKPRDIFDLAVVYTHMKTEMLGSAAIFFPHLDVLADKIEALVKAELLELYLDELNVISPEGQKIR